MSTKKNPNEQHYEAPTVTTIGDLVDLTLAKDELRSDQLIGIVPNDFSGPIR